MDQLTQRVAALTPEQRRRLEAELQKRGVEFSILPILPRAEDMEVVPLSYAQQRLWFLQQLDPGSSAYNIPALLRLAGYVDVAMLRRAFGEIVSRHEILRTGFSESDGLPVQHIHDSPPLSFHLVDLAHLSLQAGEQEALARVQAEANRPFDLSQDALFRIHLFRLEEEDHFLLVNMHHIVSDGWSSDLLIRELAHFYDAYRSGHASALPSLSIQYGDFALWQRQRLQGEYLQEQLDYWRRQLGDEPPPLNLSTDHSRPPVLNYRGDSIRFDIPHAVYSALQRLSQGEGATLFMTTLAAFQALLHRYTAQERILVGTPVANRNRPEVQDLIGFFVNTLVMVVDFDTDLTFRQLLDQVQTMALEAYEHQDLPFDLLVERLQPERDASRSPLFQVFFALQPDSAEIINALGFKATLFPLPVTTAKFDLSLILTQSGDGLSGTLQYATDLFEASTIERMVGHFLVLLGGIVADPDCPVSSLPLLTDVERQQLLVTWNETAVPYPDRHGIHHLFE